MRVIAGQARGLRLSSPSGTNTRPTLDRVKEAVFSMLMPFLNDAVVLDLFAGSGAMGIEALSRGAHKAVFVDILPEAIGCIKSNINSARMENKSLVFKSDALAYLKNTDLKFDLIFLDPPYESNLYSDAIKLISQNKLLTENGFIITEWDTEIGFPCDCQEFEIHREKKYGRVGITTLKWG